MAREYDFGPDDVGRPRMSGIAKLLILILAVVIGWAVVALIWFAAHRYGLQSLAWVSGGLVTAVLVIFAARRVGS
jgi:hypothetical protein